MENANNLPCKKTSPLPKANQELRHSYAKQVYALEVLRAVTFPSITAFVILSAYSFYLIQSLATDIHQMQEVMVNMDSRIHANLDTLSKQMETSKNHMSEIVQSAKQINSNVHNIHGDMRSMANDAQQMDASTQNMAVSVYNMQRALSGINKN